MGLSPHGHAQADALARWLADTPLDAIYASPMQRVQATMAPSLIGRGVAPVILPDLRETDFGQWTGLTWAEVKERFGVNAFDWLEVLERGELPGGETGDAVLTRLQPCIARILDENPHRRAAVFCHGGIIRCILSLLLELPLSKMAHFRVEYGSVTVVELQPEKKHGVELELLNFSPMGSKGPSDQR